MAITASQPNSAPLLAASGIERFQKYSQLANVNNDVAAPRLNGVTTQTAQEKIDQVQLSPAARQAYATAEASAKPVFSPELEQQTSASQPVASAADIPQSSQQRLSANSATATDTPYTAYQQPAVNSSDSDSANRDTASNSVDSVHLSPEAQQQLMKLAQRDREVQVHEAAHAAVGGRYTGAPKLSYTTGPDGKRYAVSGEVNVDMSEIPGDPAATIKKAETVHAAALAPAQPSAQDRNVAAKALQMKAEARAELMAESTTTSTEMLENSATTAPQSTSGISLFKGVIA